MAEAKRYIEPFRPVFLLVGCKLDLAAQRQVGMEEVFDYGAAHGIHFIETSAKSGENVEDAFQTITQDVYNKIQVSRASFLICAIQMANF